jgi:hypothetical protein
MVWLPHLQDVAAVGLEQARTVAPQRVRPRHFREYQARGGLQVEHQPLEQHLQDQDVEAHIQC